VTIGEKIKQFRLNKGLKQSELAEKSGVSRVSIGLYERDERVPRVEHLEKIASVLGVKSNNIIGVSYFDKKKEDENLADDVKRLETFESYLSSLGYTVKYAFDGEDGSGDGCAFITKDGLTAGLSTSEFETLQQKFIELQGCIDELQSDYRAIIETRIQTKAGYANAPKPKKRIRKAGDTT